MADDTPAATQSIIRTFEKRARRRQWEAYGFLVVMLAGIAAAAYVFINAKEITDQETKTNTVARLADIRKNQKENASKLDEEQSQADVVARRRISELPIDDTSDCARKGGVILNSFDILMPTKLDFIKKIISYGNDNKCVFITLYRDNNGAKILATADKMRTSVDIDKLKVITDTNWNAENGKNFDGLINDHNDRVHQADIMERAVNVLMSNLTKEEIAPLLGNRPEANASPTTLSLPFLLQLNITRFGTITLVVIALGILAPLYRFSARLATFYQARADVLKLHQITGYKQTGIIRLSPVFTPNFDFAKSQTTPDHMLEMLRAALAHGKEE